MIIAYKKLDAANRFLWIAGFSIIPLLYGMLYHHIFLNWLLKKGISSHSHILGTPSLILLHFFVMLILLIIFRKKLLQSDKTVSGFTLNESEEMGSSSEGSLIHTSEYLR